MCLLDLFLTLSDAVLFTDKIPDFLLDQLVVIRFVSQLLTFLLGFPLNLETLVVRLLLQAPIPLVIFDFICMINGFFRGHRVPLRLEFIFLKLGKAIRIFLLHHLNAEEALVLIMHSLLVFFSELGLMIMIHHFIDDSVVDCTVLLIYRFKPGLFAL